MTAQPAASRHDAPVPQATVTPAAQADDPAGGSWSGRTREYDLLREFVIALVVVGLLTAAAAALFSSPDEPQVTLSSWSTAAPADFLATAATELDGTSASALYGAPYNRTPHAGQQIGPLALQHIAGVTQPVNSAVDFVLRPLSAVRGDGPLTSALARWGGATAAQQDAWSTDYDTALQHAPGKDPATVAAGDYGPVPVLLNRLLSLAQAGGLDGALLLQGALFQTDYTKPLLFMADGTYLADRGDQQRLAGKQWGMMNETGNYPGQSWLWLYTFWYQVPPFSTSGNADALVMGLMALLSVGLVCVPFLPGVRSIPRWIPVHRLNWRSYYTNPGMPGPLPPTPYPTADEERPTVATRP